MAILPPLLLPNAPSVRQVWCDVGGSSHVAVPSSAEHPPLAAHTSIYISILHYTHLYSEHGGWGAIM